MIINSSNDITVISAKESNIDELARTLKRAYPKLKENHLIIDLSPMEELSPSDLMTFQETSDVHKASEKSFVLVVIGLNYDDISDGLVVVPTLQEAYDMIEMESIERDLGL